MLNKKSFLVKVDDNSDNLQEEKYSSYLISFALFKWFSILNSKLPTEKNGIRAALHRVHKNSQSQSCICVSYVKKKFVLQK